MHAEPLRGLTPLNSEYRKNLHEDLFLVCVTLLARDRYFIIEDALIRAGKRLNRADVQWPVLKKWLEEQFGVHQLTVLGRAKLRDWTHGEFPRLKVLKDVKVSLQGGNGNSAAGYSFAHWDREMTERQISARHHSAESFENSAERLRTDLERGPTVLLQPEPGEEAK